MARTLAMELPNPLDPDGLIGSMVATVAGAGCNPIHPGGRVGIVYDVVHRRRRRGSDEIVVVLLIGGHMSCCPLEVFYDYYKLC